MKFNEQIPKKELVKKNTGVLGEFKKTKISKLARAVALGTLIANSTAQAQETSSVTENPPQELTIKDLKKYGLKLETESDWIEYAKNRPREALYHLKEIINAPYASRVAEVAIRTDPHVALGHYERYKDLINADDLLEMAVKLLLSKGEEGPSYVFDELETIKHLENFESYATEAAEKSYNHIVMNGLDKLFKNLPKNFAESIAQNACNRALKEYPWSIIVNAKEIREYLPNSRFLINDAINYFLDEKIDDVFDNIDNFMRAVPEEEQVAFAEKLLRLDPVRTYEYYSRKFDTRKIDEETGKLAKPINYVGEFLTVVSESNSPEATIVRQIFEAEITAEQKPKLPLIMDEFVFNKRFTIEQAVKIVENKEQLLKLIGEITKRKNYIGRESIKTFLNAPVKNKIVEE